MAFDEAHLDELCAFVVEHLDSREGWSAALQHVDASLATNVEIKPVPMEIEGVSRMYRIFRIPIDVPTVDAGFATRCLIARSRFKEFNEFILSEELVAALRGPDPEDADGLGIVHVYADRHSYFGWRLQSLMMYATRRLPDGSGLLLKVPAEIRPDGLWTTRGHLAKQRAIVAWWIRPAPGGKGCRLSSMQLVLPQGAYTFLPESTWVQIFVRLLLKTILRAVRTLLSEHGAERGAPSRPLRLPFASGSASAPLHFGTGLAAGLASVPPQPRVLHALSAPPPLPAPAPRANELFFDFVGIKEEAADAAGVPPAPELAQDMTLEMPAVATPAVLSRAGMALHATADLALRFESMSLGEGRAEGGTGPETRDFPIERAPPGPPKANARQWSEEVADEDPEGRAPATFRSLDGVRQEYPGSSPAEVDEKTEGLGSARTPQRAEGCAAAARVVGRPRRRQSGCTPRASPLRIAPGPSSAPSAPLDLSDMPRTPTRGRPPGKKRQSVPPLSGLAPVPPAPPGLVLGPVPLIYGPPPVTPSPQAGYGPPIARLGTAYGSPYYGY